MVQHRIHRCSEAGRGRLRTPGPSRRQKLINRRPHKIPVIEADGHESRYGEKESGLEELMASHGYRLDESLSVLGNPSGNCAVYSLVSQS